ncbi:Shedu immune nuclease family protein [Photobacterium kishitanii]|uniref:Shedu immune nuclease family protein n=1 Tax=Photobacterium kishitanii TaxID=318456 RepID=UPI000430BBB4|nr:Shedu immune nuclease family protein [Photobacterium kishitanii]OBU30797.1 hypothetical protein AYY23_05530 [Photobacterium kishitanii]PSW48681.1 DUF4263 domain-containing protein [Photobacterium kishitanii]CEO40955.1 conserved hypothetical protein [Photobacterium kishitanii]
MDNYENPVEGRTYISPSLNQFIGDRKIRIASKVIESPDTYAFGMIKDEMVIRHKTDAKSYITAKFFEDTKGIFVLNIQGYSVATDKPHNASFSFVGDEIGKLVEFIRNIQSINFTHRDSVNITDEELSRITLSDSQVKTLLQDNHELFTEVLRSEITTKDIVSVGYRKKQIDVFRRLLNDEQYFSKLKAQKKTKDEGLWQKYFEKNEWIFGYGLGYLFLSGLDDKKLEQVVQGHSVVNHGKRVDALMKTKGIISNLCFVEIKIHTTKLLDTKPYRAGCWAPSKELAGAVAQVQGTVASAIDSLSTKISLDDAYGNPTGNEIYNYQPKSFLVIGSLEEFSGEHGVNKDQLRSFELFRKNTINPEIITFDELYERARFIVHHNES